LTEELGRKAGRDGRRKNVAGGKGSFKRERPRLLRASAMQSITLLSHFCTLLCF